MKVEPHVAGVRGQRAVGVSDDDTPGSRLEPALQRAPLIDAQVDALGLAWREEAGERLLAQNPLSPMITDALTADDGDTLSDLRLIVASLEGQYLNAADMTLACAAAVGRLSEGIGYFTAGMRSTDRVSFAVITFEQEFYALLDGDDALRS